jgi:hypothetical protein
VDDVIPANAERKGMPPPVIVGTRDNINTGIPELDEEFYGVWWMKNNPVPEELASMAGAFSEYTGQNLSASEVNWSKPVVVGVPNSRHNHWAWVETWTSENLIMPTYTSADFRANNFTMHSTKYGEIGTSLTDFPLVWVDKWTLEKLEPDTWLRRTLFQNHSLFSDNNYTLTRIINEDGSPTKYWPDFKEYMETNMTNTPLLVWDTDDVCKRACMLAELQCHECHDCCTGGKDGQPRWNCRFGWGWKPNYR